MALADPAPNAMSEAHHEWAWRANQREASEVFTPAMAALFELGAELGELLDELVDDFAVARIERSIAGIDEVLAELLSLRADTVSIDLATKETS